ncbi:MAG: hypothetical protein FWC64_01940 [Treponema sp.]|nr:hypothetical protein [Treponema sp.]
MKKSFCLFVVFFSIISTKAFCGPFGVRFGMSLEQISQISRTVPEPLRDRDNWFLITPPNTHELFDIYLVSIHPVRGVYFIRAVSREIRTNTHGAELIAHFNTLVSGIERIYGSYLRRDRMISDTRLTSSQFFMNTLSRGDRELIVFWHREEGSTLPDDIYEIIISAEAISSFIGYIMLDYYSIYFDAIEEERSSVF